MKVQKVLSLVLALTILCGTLLTVNATEEIVGEVEIVVTDEITETEETGQVLPEERTDGTEEAPGAELEKSDEAKEAYRLARLARRDEKIAAARQKQQERIAARELRQAEAARIRQERIEARELRQTEAAQRKEQRQQGKENTTP